MDADAGVAGVWYYAAGVAAAVSCCDDGWLGAKGRAEGYGCAVVLGAGCVVVGHGAEIGAGVSIYGAQVAGGPEFLRGAEFGGCEVPVGEVGGFLQLGVAVRGWGVGGSEVGAGRDVGGHVWVGGDIEAGGDDDGNAICEGVGGKGEQRCQ